MIRIAAVARSHGLVAIGTRYPRVLISFCTTSPCLSRASSTSAQLARPSLQNQRWKSTTGSASAVAEDTDDTDEMRQNAIRDGSKKNEGERVSGQLSSRSSFRRNSSFSNRLGSNDNDTEGMKGDGGAGSQRQLWRTPSSSSFSASGDKKGDNGNNKKGGHYRGKWNNRGRDESSNRSGGWRERGREDHRQPNQNQSRQHWRSKNRKNHDSDSQRPPISPTSLSSALEEHTSGKDGEMSLTEFFRQRAGREGNGGSHPSDGGNNPTGTISRGSIWRTTKAVGTSSNPRAVLGRRDTTAMGTVSSLSRITEKEEEDMSDISSLRAAFLQSVQQDRERRIAELQQQQQNHPDREEETNLLERISRERAERLRSESSSSSGTGENRGRYRGGRGYGGASRLSSSDMFDRPYREREDQPQQYFSPERSSWRDATPTRSSSKGYREHRKTKAAASLAESEGLGEWKQKDRNINVYGKPKNEWEIDTRFRDTAPLSRITNEKAKEGPRNDVREDKSVILPPRPLTISEFSSLLRVKVETLRDTLLSLGENISSKNENEYEIDVDVMELVALELGFDPTRGTRRMDGRQHGVDEAERRLRRVANGSLEEDVQESGAATEMETPKAVEDAEYEKLPPRPPVVCIMGHVDHGKTTLLDALRRRSREAAASAASGKSTGGTKNGKKKDKKAASGKANGKRNGSAVGDVAGTEAGGITQAISAFQVALPQADETYGSGAGGAVTFLDTPGHAAFKAMRESGTNAADVIVLVVAADDGVSKQTVEVLNFYKSVVRSAGAGGISLVVAVTKIDKHGVDVDEAVMRIENQLMQHDIFSESVSTGGNNEYGSVQIIPISAMTGQGLDDLIEGLALQSEIMDLRADVKCRAEGIILDARVEKGLGVVADCIVRWGTLERGDFVVSGVHGGKVRILNDVNGNTVKKATPSQPVRIIGFKSLPKAGDPIVCVGSEQIGKDIINRREAMSSMDTAQASFRSDGSLDGTDQPELQITGTEAKHSSMMQNLKNRYGLEEEAGTDTDQTIRIPVVIVADANGSLDAVKEALLAIGSESSHNLIIDPVGLSTGPVSATDVRMARESGAAIFAFGVKGSVDSAALSLAESEDVVVRSHDVIYHLLDDAKDVFATYLPPVEVDKVHGRAVVKAVFDVNNKRNAERVAGLMVQEGTLYKHKSRPDSDKGESLVCHYRVLRKGKIVSPEGAMLRAASLRRVKDDVDDVRRGDECGLCLSDYENFEPGDIVECYSTEMKNVFI